MLKDLVKQSRSYRSFDPAVKITQEQLLEFADAARLTPSTTNLHPPFRDRSSAVCS